MMCAMSTSLSHEMTYDAPLARVAAMLTDATFRTSVYDAQRATSCDVTATGTTQSGEVSIDYTLPTVGLPSFAKKIVGDGVRIVQREQWAGDKASLHLTIPGKPGEVSGTITLTESGGVTLETVSCEIRVTMPLVGGKVERLIEEMLLKSLRKENRVGQEWLAR